MLPKLRRLVRLPWRNASQIADEVDAEFAFHLEMRVAELRATGMDEEDARREAIRRFGNVSEASDYCRRTDARVERARRRSSWIADLRHDLSHAVRHFSRSPGTTALIVLMLGVGIGATTAMFSAVDRLLLHPVKGPDGDRIYSLMRADRSGTAFVEPTTELVRHWRAGVPALEEIATVGGQEVTLTDSRSGDVESLQAGSFSANAPHLLGAQVMLGRSFSSEETKVGGPPVAILGYGLWRRRFGGSSSALGQSIQIDGKSVTIVGVLPADFRVPFVSAGSAQLWLPEIEEPGGTSMAIGKLRLGLTTAELERELRSVLKALAESNKTYAIWDVVAKRPQDYLGNSTRDLLLVLLAAVAIVLLIACANIANILLARALGRQREFVIRAALGAGRSRVLRQVLAESVLLAVAGGTAGVFVAWRALALIVALRPQSLDDLEAVRLEPRVLLVTLAISVLTGVVFGIAPALLTARESFGGALKGTGRTTSGERGAGGLRRALIVGEVALSVVLLVGAGLLIQTLVRLQSAPIGFDPRGLASAEVRLPLDRYRTPRDREAVLPQLLEQVRAIPGVELATWSEGVPPRTGVAFGALEIEGRTLEAADKVTLVGYNSVTPEFFRVVGLSVREGHVITADTALHSVTINERFARKYWPGSSAVGRRFRLGEGNWMTVAAVVSDVTIPNAGEADVVRSLQLYGSFSGEFEGAVLAVRFRGDGAGLYAAIVRATEHVDPLVRVRQLVQATDALERELTRPRFNVVLLTSFAVLGLLLSAAGLYGVIAFSVSQRAREMGIRLALGASPQGLLRLVLGEGARLTMTGLLLGLAGAAAATRALRGLLYDVGPWNGQTFAVAALVLGVVAMAASVVPALRAMRSDPALTLRDE